MSRTRQYTRKELESLRRADLQSLFKIHGLKGANQKSDALIDQLISHFTTVSTARVQSPIVSGAAKAEGRRLKSIDIQSTGRAGDVSRRPGTSASTSRLTASRPQLVRPPSRIVASTTTPMAIDGEAGSSTGMTSGEWEERFRKLEERQRRSELESEERLRLVQDKLMAVEAELRAVKAEMDARIAELPSLSADVTLSPPASTPRVIVTDPSPLKRSEPTPSSPESSNVDGQNEPSRKKARIDGRDGEMRDWTQAPMTAEPHTPQFGFIGHVPMAGPSNPHTPSPSHQGTSDDMSRTPGVEGSITGLPFPIFATTPKPREPHSPTLDAPPSASRQRAWSSSSLPKMLTPGRKRVEPAPRAVSQAHMDLTTITESEEAPVMRRLATPPVVAPLYPASLSRDGTITPPRLSPSPSITESRFQHPTLPSRGSNLVPAGAASGTSANRGRKASTPAREYMEVALHGLGGTSDSPRPQVTPSHRTILGTERYRDTRFGDIPVVAWGSPGVDFGPATPQVNLGRD